MPNRLAHETSPYLLQHRDNPVDWYPWGPEALAEAAASNRPILLSVGYAACHWCHVMAHESFEDPATAEVMNRLFVNIKVDREERPDIDQIYMAALHALGQQGGWPLTMFLTPGAEPVWGGTYFPPASRYGRPAFTDVLTEIARIFREEGGRVEQNRQALLERLRTGSSPGRHGPDRPLLDAAAAQIEPLFDPVHGGFRGAPKFPQAGVLEFLWRSGARTGIGRYADAVTTTLRNICQGGIYDHVGGGFARYSVDEQWLVPHFEKMLYDNAQLVERLTYAWLASRDPLFRSRIEETVAWLFEEMTTAGAFAASLDADSPGGEGSFYVWTPVEVEAVLGPAATSFCAAYDITAEGNFDGASIPNRLRRPWPADVATEAAFAEQRAALRRHRARRPPPARDDKILADWNGLTIAALATAGAALDRPDWTARAAATFRFVHELMQRTGRIGHALRDGRLTFPGFASDLAALLKASLALHAATGDPAWLSTAAALAAEADLHFWDDAAGLYAFTADDAEALVARLHPVLDEATPSPNGLMAENLVRLWRLTGDDAWRARADRILASAGAAMAENIVGTAALLNALDMRLGAVEIVILAPDDAAADALRRAAWSVWRETFVLSTHGDAPDLPPAHPAAGRRAKDGRATAYVCRNETCSLPVTEPAELIALLRPGGSGNTTVAPASEPEPRA